MPDEIEHSQIEQSLFFILFVDDSIILIELAEPLGERERILRDGRWFKGYQNLTHDFVESRCQVNHFPNVVRSVQQFREPGVLAENGDFGKIEAGFGFAKFGEDAIRTDRGVLKIWAGFSLKAEGFLEIKRDDRIAGEFQQKVPEGADRDLMGDL